MNAELIEVSEGIAEAIALSLNGYDLTDDQYTDLFNGAAGAFLDYVEAHKPGAVLFDRRTCTFLDYDTFNATARMTEAEQEDLLRAAEAAADAWVEDAAAE